jgi:hypothetical protein
MKAFWLGMISMAVLLSACAQPGAAGPAETTAPLHGTPASPSQPLPSAPALIETVQKPIYAASEPATQPIPLLQATTIQLEFNASENVRLAVADLAARLDTVPEDIEIVAVIQSEYSQQAFYCRVDKERVQKEAATQVIYGETILLRAGARAYEYHASDQAVVFCRQLR